MKHGNRSGSLRTEDGPVQVLLVEDNRVNRIVATKMLNRLGCEVTIVENGQLALDVLRDRGEAFNLVFMDVQMPVMDGETAARCIRQDERFETLPVIAMTAHAMVGDRERCLDAGMDDYFTKPVKVEHIKAMVEKWKDGRRVLGGESPTGHDAADAVQPEETSAQSPTDRPCPIALERALANLDGDAELLEDVVQIFLETTPELLATLSEAVRSGCAPDIAAAAHSIKGSAANIGAESVSESARKLEVMGKSAEVSEATKEVEVLVARLGELVSFAKEKFASCADIPD